MYTNSKEEIAVTVIQAIVVLAAIIVLALIIVSSAINESNRISSGTVTDKAYRAAHYNTTYTSIDGILIPNTHYVPERYSIEIQGEKNGKLVEYWFEVTATEYEKYTVGDCYPK